MKVSELIEKLKKMPQDADVSVRMPCEWCNMDSCYGAVEVYKNEYTGFNMVVIEGFIT